MWHGKFFREQLVEVETASPFLGAEGPVSCLWQQLLGLDLKSVGAETVPEPSRAAFRFAH